MSWFRRQLFKYFNQPPFEDAPFIIDTGGRRFYYEFVGDPVDDIWYWYKGRHRARIQLIWRSNQQLQLADIVIFDTALRGCGLGSAMFQQLLEIAKDHGVRLIFGHIINTDGPDIARQQNFYRMQGCEVKGDKFHITIAP